MSEQPKPPSKTKLTKAVIDALPQIAGKQYIVSDTELKGFAVRVGATSKTFIAYKRIPNGAPQKVTLGKYGALTVEQARKLAQEKLSQLVHGVDINAEKKAARLEAKKYSTADAQTLQWLLDFYKTEHIIKQKNGKDGTLRSIQDTINFFDKRPVTLLKKVVSKDGKSEKWEVDQDIVLSNWLERPFREIKPKEVLERYDFYARARPTRLIGGVLAPMQRTFQIAFKFAQAAFNFYIQRLKIEALNNDQEPEVLPNPFDVLKVFKRWTEVNRRDRVIEFRESDHMGKWIEAVIQYRKKNEVAADFMLFSLIQAGRSIELWGLEWSKVDFARSEVSYTDTKNGEDYVFPLTKLGLEILQRRRDNNPKEGKHSEFVWYYPASETGHIPEDAKHHFHELEKHGAKYVSSHDLKRTWATASHTLRYNERDINYLLKHKDKDINAHYFIRNRALVLEILQGIEDLFMAEHAKHLAKLVAGKGGQPTVEEQQEAAEAA